MIAGHGDAEGVIAEVEGELALAEELLVHPAAVVHVGAHARVELRDGVEVVVLLGEVLVAAAAAHLVAVVDGEPPGHLEVVDRTGRQGLGQVDAHHGLVDGVLQLGTSRIGDTGDAEATFEGLGPALQRP